MYDEDGLRIDPIEKDPKYSSIFEKIDDEVEEYIKKEMPNAPRGMGYCHLFWDTKKELLKSKYKIKWRSPAEMKQDPKFTKNGIKTYRHEEVTIPMGYDEKLPNGTTVRFIADDKLNDKKVLGRAVAINLSHAVMLGIKYTDNFLSRVQGYRIVEDDGLTKTATQATGLQYTTYEFYELAE